MGWQWHQLDHMQIICISRQTDNHASTSSLNFSWCPAISVKALKTNFATHFTKIIMKDSSTPWTHQCTMLRNIWQLFDKKCPVTWVFCTSRYCMTCIRSLCVAAGAVWRPADLCHRGAVWRVLDHCVLLQVLYDGRLTSAIVVLYDVY